MAVPARRCTDPGVQTESASEHPAPAVAADDGHRPRPRPTPHDRAVPDDPGSGDRRPAPRPRSTSTSAGDSLYPELGSADLDVQSYDVRLSYDPQRRSLEGTVTINTAVRRSVDELVLDADELDVDSVTVDGSPATSPRPTATW